MIEAPGPRSATCAAQCQGRVAKSLLTPSDASPPRLTCTISRIVWLLKLIGGRWAWGLWGLTAVEAVEAPDLRPLAAAGPAAVERHVLPQP